MTATRTLRIDRQGRTFEDEDAKLIPVVSVDPALEDGLLIAVGSVPGASVVHKFGRNDTVITTGTGADIWSPGGDYTGWIQTAVAVRIKAGGDAADDAAGAGAQSVLISGLDQDWAPATDVVATAGASASLPTTTTFIRVNRCYVVDVGTYGAGVGSNVGDIVIETTGGVVMAQIDALSAQTEMAIWAVPAGVTAYLSSFHVHVGGGSKTTTVSVFARENADVTSSPFGATRLRERFVELAGYVPISYPSPPRFTEKSDVWVRGLSQTQANAVSATLCLTLIDN